jgi:hypothetical protein
MRRAGTERDAKRAEEKDGCHVWGLGWSLLAPLCPSWPPVGRFWLIVIDERRRCRKHAWRWESNALGTCQFRPSEDAHLSTWDQDVCSILFLIISILRTCPSKTVEKRNSGVNKESCANWSQANQASRPCLQPIRSLVIPPPAVIRTPVWAANLAASERVGERVRADGARLEERKPAVAADDLAWNVAAVRHSRPRHGLSSGPPPAKQQQQLLEGLDHVSHRSIASRSTRHVLRRPALDMQTVVSSWRYPGWDGSLLDLSDN